MCTTECPYCGLESTYLNGTEMECPNCDSSWADDADCDEDSVE